MGLAAYALKRALSSIALFFVSVSFAFFLFRLLGNPVTIMVGPGLPPTAVKVLTAEFGLNRPLWLQFVLFWRNFFTGNLGFSFLYSGVPVLKVIFPTRFLNTVVLMGGGMAISYVISIPLGLIAGRRGGTTLDKGLSGLSVGLISLPAFWLALVILLGLGFYLGWIPLGGTISITHHFSSWWAYSLNYVHHLAGPMLSIAVFFFGTNFLITRASAANVFREDFIRTFEAAGESERRIVFGHGLRNAMLPELSLMAVQMSFIVAGAIFTEAVFSWNGMGSLIYLAVENSDYPVLQGTFIFIVIVVIAANFVADLLYAVIDPRVRYD